MYFNVDIQYYTLKLFFQKRASKKRAKVFERIVSSQLN